MTDWFIEPTENYNRAHKYYEKKHPNELIAVLDNLDKYFKILCNSVNPQFIVAGFIHDEPKGVKALDQRGSGKGKLQQARLYIYADIDTKILHLITIGDKKSQHTDIKQSSDFVIKLKGA